MGIIIYPEVKDIINDNKIVLEEIRVKKADQPKVLSEIKIDEVINECKKSRRDLYYKAAILLEGLTKKHPFASGNRRTALVSTIKFLLDNKKQTGIKNEPEFAKILTGIREGFYTREEILNWLKNGKIKKFERRWKDLWYKKDFK